MSKLSQTKSTHYIREQLGLSQMALAHYLSISLSQLAMYEIGKRELPTGTMAKLAEILLFLNEDHAAAKQENEILKTQEAKAQEVLKKQIKEWELAQLKAQRKLEALQKKFKQNVKLKAFVTHFENKKSSLLEGLHIQAHTGIEKNGLVAQTILLLKLESLKSQLAYYKNVKEYKKKS